MSEFDPLDDKPRIEKSKDKADVIRRSEQKDSEDIKWLMSSRRGRRLVWRQLCRAGVFRSSFNTNSMAMAFAEGMKNEGLYLLAAIHKDAGDLYETMVKEAQNDN